MTLFHFARLALTSPSLKQKAEFHRNIPVMKPKKRLPKFKSEDEERRFWSTHDSTDYLDWSKAQRLSSLRGFLKGMKTSPTREKRDRH